MISGGTPAADQSSGSLESIEVGGKQYSKIGDICTQVTAENAPQSNTMMDPNSIIGGVRGAQRLGNETVNGVPTVHYKVDASNLNVLGYLNSDGDVWVADPGNYVVKYTLQATATGKTISSAARWAKGPSSGIMKFRRSTNRSIFRLPKIAVVRRKTFP
jgi:hypothetical protein